MNYRVLPFVPLQDNLGEKERENRQPPKKLRGMHHLALRLEVWGLGGGPEKRGEIYTYSGLIFY